MGGRLRQWLVALVALSVGACQQVRDGGPHPEPPVPLPSDDRDGGAAGGHAGQGASGGTGGLGGAGGSAGLGSGGMDHVPPCEDDAGFADEDAGALR